MEPERASEALLRAVRRRWRTLELGARAPRDTFAPAAQVAAVRTAAARLDALLDYELGYTALTGYRVLGCRRTAPVDVALEEATGRYVQVGGEYTIWVTAA